MRFLPVSSTTACSFARKASMTVDFPAEMVPVMTLQLVVTGWIKLMPPGWQGILEKSRGIDVRKGLNFWQAFH